MRIIREFPFTDHIKASLFSWNGKYILKLECGMMEQTYKISEMDAGNPDELLNWYSNTGFRQKAEFIFSEMEKNFPD